MAISPIILNGTIQQTQDVLQNQTKETQKAMVDQGNIFAQEVKQEHQKAKQVVHSENSQLKEERFDAREKSKGSYQGDGGRHRKSRQEDGCVVIKPEGGFDIKI